MPKIIENVREQLLAEAMKQIRENGYQKTTIRSVAGACKLSVGTVYNYFPSKDMLIASFMLEDWQKCMKAMKKGADEATEAKSVLECIYNELHSFIQNHQTLFQDSEATKVFAYSFSERHKQLREQLQQLIQPLCEKEELENAFFYAEFIAESLLTWTVAGKSFEEIYCVLHKLIK